MFRLAGCLEKWAAVSLSGTGGASAWRESAIWVWMGTWRSGGFRKGVPRERQAESLQGLLSQYPGLSGQGGKGLLGVSSGSR